jgi:hypothetical protein
VKGNRFLQTKGRIMDDTPHAFPRPSLPRDNYPGMTLRDYFAAKAMMILPELFPNDKLTKDFMAATAYSIADAMLAARAISVSVSPGATQLMRKAK